MRSCSTFFGYIPNLYPQKPSMDRPHKRQRTGNDGSDEEIESLSRPISPPRKQRRETRVIPSPWQLTWIRDLPEELNQDAVALKDLLGDPLISECWEFNFLHNIRFLMDAFDPDTRHLVKVHVVHGFWKREDPNRRMLVEEASEFSNVSLHVAPMLEMFGTHHSKMMILFRHDDTAQVIIHTANMIPKDWTNMTNAVWTSPRLPKMAASATLTDHPVPLEELPVGSGRKLKADLLGYLRAYDSRRITCKPLSDELSRYDFSAVRGALVASVPGRHHVHDQSQTAWGWASLKRNLRSITCDEDGDSEVVVQISSIATLGARDEWLQRTLFDSLAMSKGNRAKRPKFKVVFPTADEIRRSLDGYASGASIHTKIQSAQQAKQLLYLRPIFHHWANDSAKGKEMPAEAKLVNAGHNRAAPHIKTYIRYNQANRIDWALLTSSNLSKQAWGEAANASGQARIASWEIGVMVWPGLFEDAAVMVSMSKSDTPSLSAEESGGKAVVGVRVPYSLPLQRYGDGEVPWVASMNHAEVDCLGLKWTDV